MPTRKVIIPKTTNEAIEMIKRGWWFLAKKYPVFVAPLSFWMIFGGAIFMYNYVAADRFEVKEAKPLSQPTSANFSIMPQAYAGGDGPPIIFNGQLWGYEDTRFIVKAVANKPILLVYDQISKKVYEVEFYGASYKQSK